MLMVLPEERAKVALGTILLPSNAREIHFDGFRWRSRHLQRASMRSRADLCSSRLVDIQGQVITVCLGSVGTGCEELGVLELCPHFWDLCSGWRAFPGQEMSGVACGKVPLHCAKVNRFSAAIGVEDCG